jgi:ribosome biogenesis GTPase
LSVSHLSRFGWTDRVAALFGDLPCLPARVVRVDRDRCAVATADGESVASFDMVPAVGDWVGLDESARGDIPHRVVYTAPRWSELGRLDPTSFSHDHLTGQTLAANVDVVVITAPLDRPLSQARVERETVVAWDAGAQPVVALTKADRHPDPEAAAAELSRRLTGVDVILTAALDGVGVDAVAALFRPNLTALLLGASGAGKSTLTNALLGGDVMATGGVRRADSRGKHTTTVRHLLPVPGGGVIIDSPGIRSLGLAGANDGISVAFADLEELACACRFSDCAHTSEPGCAITRAIEEGRLDRARLKSWQKLLREVAMQERKGDPKATAAHRREVRELWKMRAREVRARTRY